MCLGSQAMRPDVSCRSVRGAGHRVRRQQRVRLRDRRAWRRVPSTTAVRRSCRWPGAALVAVTDALLAFCNCHRCHPFPVALSPMSGSVQSQLTPKCHHVLFRTAESTQFAQWVNPIGGRQRARGSVFGEAGGWRTAVFDTARARSFGQVPHHLPRQVSGKSDRPRANPAR
jgi:hypothetical protein